tara:strand:- start:1515 stop:2042 length:528 start_codon:yes stop_codon:yes gene_type:complete
MNKRLKQKKENFGDSGSEDEKFLLDMLSNLASRLKDKYEYSDDDILNSLKQEIEIPIDIFLDKLSPGEAIAKYLHENHNLEYSKISELIGRESKSVWANYKRAAKKLPKIFHDVKGSSVPVSIFKSDLSMFESLVSYLKDQKKMTNAMIAKLLKRDPRNIWSLYARSRKKKHVKR